MADPYGFTDNYHPAFTRGWRFWLIVLGVFEWQMPRRLTGLRWELWWIDPCCSAIWHPVTRPSSVEPPVRPCPWRHRLGVEDWTADPGIVDFLRRHLPISPYTPKHVLDTNHRGDWLIPVCMAACFLALWVPLFLAVAR